MHLKKHSASCEEIRDKLWAIQEAVHSHGTFQSNPELLTIISQLSKIALMISTAANSDTEAEGENSTRDAMIIPELNKVYRLVMDYHDKTCEP